MHTWRSAGCLAVLSLAIVGCGSESITSKYAGKSDWDATQPATVALAESSGSTSGADLSLTEVAGTSTPLPSDAAGSPIEQKIIYTASIDLVVDDIAKTKQQIDSLLKDTGGYVASYREDRSYGDRLRANWVVRIPVAKFDDFMHAVDALGVPERRQQDAQDVTAEFYDFTRRLENKRLLEERILKLLEEHTGEIKDVIEVETQLARVREDIERLEGHLHVLENKVKDTTVTIAAREERNYKPPQAPTFGRRIATTFGGSLSAMRTFGEILVLCAVAIVPWLIVPVTLVVLLIVMLRRRRAKARA